MAKINGLIAPHVMYVSMGIGFVIMVYAGIFIHSRIMDANKISYSLFQTSSFQTNGNTKKWQSLATYTSETTTSRFPSTTSLEYITGIFFHGYHRFHFFQRSLVSSTTFS
jgi:hypothetical protein